MTVPLASVKTLTVNPAFLQEIKDSNPSLWQAMHRLRLLFQSTDDRNVVAKRLVRLLDDLRESLALQFALEESYGFLEVPVHSGDEVTCKMASQACGQHCALFLLLSELAEQAEEIQYRGAAAEQLQSLIAASKAFDEKFREHEALESDLIERSFDLPFRLSEQVH